jgi:hypothetical protein
VAFLAPPPPTSNQVDPAEPPTFSVVIAAYQAAPFIGEAIESVLAQTSPAHEIIVSDDGSTDDLEGALAPYRDRILLLRQQKQGASAARNAAVQTASGSFVSILDADDVYLPRYLEGVRELAAARPDLDILTTDAYLELDGRIIGRYYPDIAKFVVGDQRRGAIHNHFVFGLASLRRSRVIGIGGYDGSTEPSADSDLFLRMILDGARAGLVDEPLAVYRLREGSLSSNRAVNMRAELKILGQAAAHPTLTPDERAFLERELTVKRALARLTSAEAALRGREPGARRHSFRVAVGELPPGYGLRTRINAVGAGLSPRLAGVLLGRRGGQSLLRPGTRGR